MSKVYSLKQFLKLPQSAVVPSVDNEFANKKYVDDQVKELAKDPKDSVRMATEGDLATTHAPTGVTYNNGAGTLTQNDATDGALSAVAIDGITAVAGNRILVKSQSSAIQNGIYTVTELGNGTTTPWQLTRADDQDGSPATNVSAGNFTFVEEGTVNKDFGFVLQAGANDPLVLGTDSLNWVKFTKTDVSGKADRATGQFAIDNDGTPTFTYTLTHNLALGAGVENRRITVSLYNSTDDSVIEATINNHTTNSVDVVFDVLPTNLDLIQWVITG